MDGTLTGTGVETYITPYKKHFDKSINESKCTNETGQGNKYDSSVVCTGTKLRRTIFRNFQKKDEFLSLDIRIHTVNSDVAFTDELPEEEATSIK